MIIFERNKTLFQSAQLADFPQVFGILRQFQKFFVIGEAQYYGLGFSVFQNEAHFRGRIDHEVSVT